MGAHGSRSGAGPQGFPFEDGHAALHRGLNLRPVNRHLDARVGTLRTFAQAGDDVADVVGQARHHAADRRFAPGAQQPAVIHRLEGEHLVVVGQGLFDVAQGRAGARGDHQFGRLVAQDTAVPADVDALADRCATVESLAVAGANAQWRGGCRGRGRGLRARPGASRRCAGPWA